MQTNNGKVIDVISVIDFLFLQRSIILAQKTQIELCGNITFKQNTSQHHPKSRKSKIHFRRIRPSPQRKPKKFTEDYR